MGLALKVQESGEADTPMLVQNGLVYLIKMDVLELLLGFKTWTITPASWRK